MTLADFMDRIVPTATGSAAPKFITMSQRSWEFVAARVTEETASFQPREPRAEPVDDCKAH